mgnify:CR=1 FL=1
MSCAAFTVQPPLTRLNASNRDAVPALRPAVIWRKLSFGTRSAQGSRFVETLLSVVETCRRQSRNVFEYLTTALEAQLAGLTEAPPDSRPPERSWWKRLIGR